MTNWYKRIFQTNLKFITVLIVVGIWILSMVFSGLKTDDDYIGEQVYWLNKTGHVKSELMRGYNNIHLENYQSVFHKLFIYQGALFTKVFGWSLTSLQAVSIAYTILFFVLLWLFFKNKRHIFQEGTFFLVICLMFLFSEFFIYTVSFRPEVMLMTLGFISFMFLSDYLESSKLIKVILSGCFAGAAFLTHLNGLVFMVAGFGLLLYRKQWFASLLFGITGSCIFMFYFYDILANSNLSYFLYQFRHDPSLAESNYHWWAPIVRVFDEHRRFFNSPKEIALTLPFIFSLLFIKSLRKKYPNLLVYTFILMMSFAFYSYSKTSKYIIIYLPFISFLIAHGWQTVEDGTNKNGKYIFRGLLLLFFVVGIVYNSIWVIKQKSEPDLVTSNQHIASLIDNNHKTTKLNVLAPPSFIFNEIGNFHIMNLMRFQFFIESHGKPKMTFSQLIDSARYYSIDYIILDKDLGRYFDVNANLAALNYKPLLYRKEESFIILKVK